jgi:hypothetical protein
MTLIIVSDTRKVKPLWRFARMPTDSDGMENPANKRMEGAAATYLTESLAER